jgi:hypothetical protein
MTIIDDKLEDFIAHYGVRGMKWGIRRKRNPKTGRVGGKKGGKGKRKVSDISDEELAKKVKRMNMEKQYRALKTEQADRKVVRKGAKAVGGILAKSSKRALTDFSSKQILKGLEKAAEKNARRGVRAGGVVLN